MTAKLSKLKPRQIKICVLLDRRHCGAWNKSRRDYVGFTPYRTISVVGYGLDYAERYRNPPFRSGILHPHLYKTHEA